MAQERVHRRLAAILAADVVGYSRLMERDEVQTLALLKSRRKQVLEPLVANHDGRIFKLTGDGALIEFGSAVNAVECAFELQHAMAAANKDQPEDSQIVLRIGINLGDVMAEGSDLYGDGVNVAARLEAIADPGSILVSSTAYEYVRNKVKMGFEDAGVQSLKNIREPVRAYRVNDTPGAAIAPAGPFADAPSIAVLSFNNMSGDPSRDHIGDGIAENIITGLSRFRDLAVIARNSTFSYKGKAMKVEDISRQLNARYVLEGSLQTAGDRIRITAQLIDGTTGRHVWAERYERKIDDIYAVLDEVTDTIVATLASGYGGRLRKASRKRVTEQQNFQVFDYFARGIDLAERFNKDDNSLSRTYLEKAVEIYPSYGKAIAKLAWSHMLDVIYGWGEDSGESWRKAQKLAHLAIERDDDESWGHWALAAYCRYQGQYERSLKEFQRAIDLNPNDADVLAGYSYCLSYDGQPVQALESMHRAMQLNPHYPDWYAEALALAQYENSSYQDAIDTLASTRNFETVNANLLLAASHVGLGNVEEATKAIGRVLQLDPNATILKWAHVEHFAYSKPELLERFQQRLRLAGLPA